MVHGNRERIASGVPGGPPCRCAAAIVALLLLAPYVASAERLLISRGAAVGLPAVSGIAEIRALELDRGGLSALRASERLTITELPLGDAVATATVTRFDPFSGPALVEVVEAGGVRRLTLPDQRYYRGRIEGDPDSLVLLIAAAGGVRGVIADNGSLYRFGPDARGDHYIWTLRDADATPPGIPHPFCDADALPGVLSTAAAQGFSGESAALPLGAAYAPTLLAEIAIDTDEEFLAKFQSSEGALAYLAELSAIVSSIYDADVGVRLVFRYIRLWATTDPWTAPDASSMVYEVSRHWATQMADVPRDAVHFISGKSPGRGAAFLSGLCNAFGYGASVVYGTFDLFDPYAIWDIYVVAHELGHTFGSVHTHCYDPPLDHCYSQESGCWDGAFEIPPEGGTVMSYCGMGHTNLIFGPTVSAVLRSGAEAAECLGPPCGDGQLDPGEECDDGNVEDGDCCTASCTVANDGASCDDGRSCTSNGTCAAGVCVTTPVADGSPCDDGKTCTSDACLAGECVGVMGPAVNCKQAISSQASKLVLKDRGGTNTKLRWTWKKGEATSLGDFGDPTTTDGYELCIYEGDSSLLVSSHVAARGTCDGHPCWSSVSSGGFLFKNRTEPGMQKLLLRSGEDGRARINAFGKWLDLRSGGFANVALPLRVQLHGAGQCWEATFGSPSVMDRNLFKAKSD